MVLGGKARARESEDHGSIEFHRWLIVLHITDFARILEVAHVTTLCPAPEQLQYSDA